MIIYSRDIYKKLFVLRLSFVLLLPLCILSFLYGNSSLGYFVSVALLTLCPIVVKDFVVEESSFYISKYYIFGLIKVTWKFDERHLLKITSFGDAFGSVGDSTHEGSGSSELGCLYMILSVFLPPVVIQKRFKLSQIKDQRSISVDIMLNEAEYDMLKRFLR